MSKTKILLLYRQYTIHKIKLKSNKYIKYNPYNELHFT